MWMKALLSTHPKAGAESYYLGTSPPSLTWHPGPKPVPEPAKLNTHRACWSWLQLPLQLVKGTEPARPGCEIINAIWFEASTLRSPWKPRQMPASESTFLHRTPEWEYPTQLCLPTDLLGSLEWDGQRRCQRHGSQRHAEQVTLYQSH